MPPVVRPSGLGGVCAIGQSAERDAGRRGRQRPRPKPEETKGSHPLVPTTPAAARSPRFYSPAPRACAGTHTPGPVPHTPKIPRADRRRKKGEKPALIRHFLLACGGSGCRVCGPVEGCDRKTDKEQEGKCGQSAELNPDEYGECQKRQLGKNAAGRCAAFR